MYKSDPITQIYLSHIYFNKFDYEKKKMENSNLLSKVIFKFGNFYKLLLRLKTLPAIRR